MLQCSIRDLGLLLLLYSNYLENMFLRSVSWTFTIVERRLFAVFLTLTDVVSECIFHRNIQRQINQDPLQRAIWQHFIAWVSTELLKWEAVLWRMAAERSKFWLTRKKRVVAVARPQKTWPPSTPTNQRSQT